MAAQRSADRDAKRQFVADRAAEAEQHTQALNDRVAELRTLLIRGLRRRNTVDPNQLRRQVPHIPLDLGPLAQPETPPAWVQFEPPAPSAVGRLFGGDARYRERLTAAQEQFEQAQSEYNLREAERQHRASEARSRNAAMLAEQQRAVEEHNRSVDMFIAALQTRDQAAVTRYLNMVLEAVRLPTYFPRKAEATFSAHGEQAVLRFQLPGPEVVPGTRAVQYVQSRDEFRELPRPAKESGELYRLVISQIALLCLHDLFAADSMLESVAFNGHVQAKRYSKVVGVSHIRELAGAMEEKRAGHGILVTTSWFTSGCWQKAREHGRMELFDGPRLKSMIKDHLGKDVLIGIDRPSGAPPAPDTTS